MTERESQYPFETKYGLMFEKFKFVELFNSFLNQNSSNCPVSSRICAKTIKFFQFIPEL